MIVHTDHHNLTYFQSPQKLTRRQVRWVVELMEYDVVLKHRAGKKMIVADALSRRADWSKGVENDNEDVTALPEELFIKALDTELRDAVALAQKTDEAALEALCHLSDPSDPPGKWSIEGPKQT